MWSNYKKQTNKQKTEQAKPQTQDSGHLRGDSRRIFLARASALLETYFPSSKSQQFIMMFHNLHICYREFL